ncbi:MAG: Arc family DNA-binding protein [Gemmatimonadaceae bacterium]
MANLTLKGVPEALVAQLKREAAEHRRSLNGEVIHRLEQSVLERPTTPTLDEIRRYRVQPRDTGPAVREHRDPDADEWLERVRALREKINVDTSAAEIVAARDEGRE